MGIFHSGIYIQKELIIPDSGDGNGKAGQHYMGVFGRN